MRRYRSLLLLAASGWLAAGLTLHAAGAAPYPAQDRPELRRPAEPSPERAALRSEHFEITYDPHRLTAAQAAEARELAEEAWARCVRLFGEAPAGPVRLELTPDFAGATGFAMPAEPQAERRGPPGSGRRPRGPLVGVRYAELDYLGLTGRYVLTHEIAHIFSGALAGTSLGEGIADWAAGEFSGIPMAAWWGPVLRDAGLWIEPAALFVTGEFEHGGEVDARLRTAQYCESGLLVRYLVDRYGWPKVSAFAAEYGKTRGRLNSNAMRSRLPAPSRRRGGAAEEEPDPRRAPDPEAVSAVFERHFGLPAAKLLAEWEAWMAAETAPVEMAQRLVLGQQIYGAVRNYEMWALSQRPGPDAEARALIRQTFTEANRALAAGQLDAARTALARARAFVERLRRPVRVAGPGSEQLRLARPRLTTEGSGLVRRGS